MIPITYLVGDATAPQFGGRKIIAHCCNNVGAWGAGFVMALSRRWREPEQDYLAWAKRCAGRLMPLGEVHFVKIDDELAVANIVAQHGTHWLGDLPPIRYDALERGLVVVADRATALSASVHLPRLGCGLAGGEWSRVEDIIKRTLSLDGVAVFVYDLPEKEAA